MAVTNIAQKAELRKHPINRGQDSNCIPAREWAGIKERLGRALGGNAHPRCI